MENTRPIDRIRDSGGHEDIGSAEDGAIVEMTKIGDRLLVIKEKSIYEFLLADKIDPNRTNTNLPNGIHKLIVNQGAESQLVSKTFLTAKTLFKSEYYNENTIDCAKCLTLSLDLLQELMILEKEINEYLSKENSLVNEYDSKKNEKASYAIPMVVNLESTCKTIFQKCDHIEQILIQIIILFYPNQGIKKTSHFPLFYDVLKTKYGENDPFSEFINGTLEFMKIIRSLRNALDHRLDTIKILNFELQPDGSIISPTIELNHKEEKLERNSVSTFLPVVLQNMITIAEITFAYLAGKNVKSGFMGYSLKEIPEDIRRYKHVRYSFWSPIGPGGYFYQ